METKKRTQATDIAEIATKLDGKVKFSSIIYSQQMLSEKYRETGVNDMYFIGKKFGLWFYTSRGNNPGFACYGYTIDRGTTGNIERSNLPVLPRSDRVQK